MLACLTFSFIVSGMPVYGMISPNSISLVPIYTTGWGGDTERELRNNDMIKSHVTNPAYLKI